MTPKSTAGFTDRDVASFDPPYDAAGYRSTATRSPSRPLVVLPGAFDCATGPVFPATSVGRGDADLTTRHAGEPLGERIIVAGRLLDGSGRPIAGQLLEIWQANAAGRYAHRTDDHRAPLDPNFTGAGRCLTAADGSYRFVTVKPGAYPWGNHPNAWRPAHVHFSVFGRAFTDRLITQMYFPGDPLLALDPIFNAVRDRRARGSLVSGFDIDATEEGWALAYRFDVVVGGPRRTPATP